LSKKYVQSVAAGAIYITFFTLISKVLGFFREVLVADLFGTSWRLDAVMIALTPVQIISGVISAGLITVFIPKYIKIKDASIEEAKHYAWAIIVIFGLLFLVSGILLYFFSEQFIKLFAPGFSREIVEYSARKLKDLSLLPLIMGIQQILSGILRAERRFLQYTLAQLFFNIVSIPVIYFTAPYFNEASYILAWVIGNLVVSLVLLLFSIGQIQPHLRLFSDDIRNTLVLTFPLILSNGLGQINNIVDKAFVSFLPSGRVSGMQYADALLGIVSGVFLMSFMTTTQTELSEFLVRKDFAKAEERMKKTMHTLLSLSIPIVLWITFMGEPLIKLIYEHGNFTNESTSIVVIALIGYSARTIILPIGLLSRQYFLIQGKIKFATYLTVLSVLTNVFFDWLLIEPFGVGGITGSTSIVTFINTTIWILLVRKEGISFLPWKRIITLIVSCGTIIITSLLIKALTNDLIYIIFGNFAFAILTIWSTWDITTFIIRKTFSKLLRPKK